MLIDEAVITRRLLLPTVRMDVLVGNSPGDAVLTSSQSGQAALRLSKARCDVVSVVFCDRMVLTRESNTLRSLWTSGPSPLGAAEYLVCTLA